MNKFNCKTDNQSHRLIAVGFRSNPPIMYIFSTICTHIQGLLFKLVDFLYCRPKVSDRVIKIISSEIIFFP